VIGYLIIGGLGLAIIVVSLLVGEIFEHVFSALNIDGHGPFSTPVIGAFLAAFGFGAALADGAGVNTSLAALVGLGAGMALGGIAWKFTGVLMDMPTDDSVRTTDLVGKPATVITRVPEGGYGEISVFHAGQLLKLSARSAAALPAGEPVRITAVTSATSVVVETAPVPAPGDGTS
jgi:membrane protein implicated in regulation of membrane protease activity